METKKSGPGPDSSIVSFVAQLHRRGTDKRHRIRLGQEAHAHAHENAGRESGLRQISVCAVVCHRSFTLWGQRYANPPKNSTDMKKIRKKFRQESAPKRIGALQYADTQPFINPDLRPYVAGIKTSRQDPPARKSYGNRELRKSKRAGSSFRFSLRRRLTVVGRDVFPELPLRPCSRNAGFIRGAVPERFGKHR